MTAERAAQEGIGRDAAAPLLEIRGLCTWFETRQGWAHAVDGLDLEIAPGETLGLVGESGCGKSTVALSILGLVPDPPGRVVAGSIKLRGRELLSLSEAALRGVRGSEVSMVFQEPMTALNPTFTAGEQVAEVLRAHGIAGRRAARQRALALLERVGIPDPARCYRAYPHQLSGGMRQRVMLAAAIACGPHLLVADEPTTALDVTVQAQILDLIADLQQREGLGVLLITHDLAVAARAAQQVAVMYAGKVVEVAPVRELFDTPRHPYTIGLLGCLPEAIASGQRPRSIAGRVPAATALPDGCRFHPRCPVAQERCTWDPPPLGPVHWPGGSHRVACHFLDLAAKS